MARKLVGRGQVTITDTTDSRQLLTYIGSTLQRQVIYDPNTDSYNPDYDITPIELIAELYIAGDTANRIQDATEIKWYKQVNSIGELVEVENDADYIVEGDSLIISRNVLQNNHSMLYQAHITFPMTQSDNSVEEIQVLSDIELVKLSSGEKGEDGEDSVLNVLITPKGDTIRNHEGTLEVEILLYKGVETVTPTTNRWYRLDPSASGDSFSGAGWAKLGESSSKLEVTSDMIDGTGTFMAIPSYDGKEYRNTVTLSDLVDTSVVIVGPNVFRNGKGSIALTAKVYDSGEEVDTEGNKYEYVWSSYDTLGNIDSSFNKYGKNITVQADEVTNIVNLQCVVRVGGGVGTF